MVTAENLDRYIEQAVKLRLCGYELLLNHSRELVLKYVNGIGPEAMPAKVRDMIDRANPTLLVASLIHDLRYTFGTGTRADFLQANADLEINTKLLAMDNYGWYNPARYWVIFKGHEARKLCDSLGWTAYCDAIEHRKTNPEIEYTEVRLDLA